MEILKAEDLIIKSDQDSSKRLFCLFFILDKNFNEYLFHFLYGRNSTEISEQI